MPFAAPGMGSRDRHPAARFTLFRNGTCQRDGAFGHTGKVAAHARRREHQRQPAGRTPSRAPSRSMPIPCSFNPSWWRAMSPAVGAAMA